MNKTIMALISTLLMLVTTSCGNAEKQTQEPSKTTENEQNVQSVEDDKKDTATKELGEDVELNDITFKINSYREVEMIKGPYSDPHYPREGAKFVVIDFDVTNNTKTPFTLGLNDYLRLVDKQEREFKRYNDTIGNIDNYFSYREISPSLPENGVIVYEIPKDSEEYVLIIFEKDISEGYGVVLKKDPKSKKD